MSGKKGVSIPEVIKDIRGGSMLDELVTAVKLADKDPNSPIVSVRTDRFDRVTIRSFLRVANAVMVSHEPRRHYLFYDPENAIEDHTTIVVMSKKWKAWMHADGNVCVDNEGCEYFKGAASSWEVIDRSEDPPVTIEIENIPFGIPMD